MTHLQQHVQQRWSDRQGTSALDTDKRVCEQRGEPSGWTEKDSREHGLKRSLARLHEHILFWEDNASSFHAKCTIRRTLVTCTLASTVSSSGVRPEHSARDWLEPVLYPDE